MNVVSVRRAGVPRAQAFLWFIYPKCPGNYCADATPTRGVWSQIRSLRAAPRSITPLMRSLPPANPPQHGQSVFFLFSVVSALPHHHHHERVTRGARVNRIRTDMSPFPWTGSALLTSELVISSQTVLSYGARQRTPNRSVSD